ncbi:MAG: lactonase family protein [Haloarculaceae archaeon]
MPPSIALVGTYTDADEDGVFSYRLADGDLERRDAVPGGEDPSYLRIGPDGERVYVVNEADEGRVRALALDRESGSLTPLNDRPTGDEGPCYCSLDGAGEYVFVAHYHGGSVAMLPVESDGEVGPRSDLQAHEGSSVDPDRQDRAHPHSIVPGPDDEYAYVPDLGMDAVVAYEIDREAGALRRDEAASVDLHDGAGPRHLVFHPSGDRGYLVGELDSTVTVLHRDADGTLSVGETVPMLPDGFDEESYAADVHVDLAGEWLYASNRGHDSIAVYDLADPAMPRPAGHEPTQGGWPRGFTLDPFDEYLLAGNQHGDNVVTFAVDDGALAPTGTEIELPSPVCIDAVETL